MFGLFKKKVPPSELGQVINKWAYDFFIGDAGRSLGMTFDDWSASDGWVKFLERKGLSIPTQELYYRLFEHCSIQAACTDLSEDTRRAMTHGAVIEGWTNKPDGYDFDTTYATLEGAYCGHHKFDRKVEPLSNVEFQFDYLPNPNVGILNAKYLIESFVIPNMKNSNVFIEGFQSYSGTVSLGVGIARRAIVQLSKSAKFS